MNKKEITKTLASAIDCFRKQRRAEAESLCEKILSADPRHAQALNLLAVMACQGGRLDAGIEYALKVLEHHPKDVQALETLGDALEGMNELRGAAEAFRRAAALQPGTARLHAKMGIALHRNGALDEAGAAYEAAIGCDRSNAENILLLAKLRREQGQLAQALDLLGRVVSLSPRHGEAHVIMGEMLARQEKWADAADALTWAVEVGRIDLPCVVACGAAQLQAGRAREAVDMCRRALAMDPRNHSAQCNLALALGRCRRLDEALEEAQKALALNPSFPKAHGIVGFVLYRLGRPDEAIAAFRREIALSPGDWSAHVNLGMVLLSQGKFGEGWKEYGYRPYAARTFVQPRWQGEDPRGKTILLFAEQGFGDTIQFARFVPELEARGAKVVMEVTPPLVRLMKTVSPTATVVAGGTGETLPPFDAYLSFLSLPMVLNVDPVASPIPLPPYLRVDEALRASRVACTESGGLRVGVVWSGSTTHENDDARSILAKDILPALAESGVRLFSLQKDPRPRDREVLADLVQQGKLTDIGSSLDDFADTAAVLANLDLVISVDTSVAHLAGALGLPVWVLLPYVPDWRWLLEREDSPWYPRMRLFRQSRLDDWGGVVSRLATALRDTKISQMR